MTEESLNAVSYFLSAQDFNAQGDYSLLLYEKSPSDIKLCCYKELN